ncbi:MAG: radical SAM protein [Thermotogota bacterium]
MKVSYATAVVMGLKKGKLNFEMPTAYLMIGEKCIYNCSFCSQAREAISDKDHLSRITWPEITFEKFLNNFDPKLFKRVCLQVVSSKNYEKELEKILEFFKDKDVLVSVSLRPKDEKEVEKLFNTYDIDNMGISVDVPEKKLFEKIRGTKYNKYMQMLINSSKKFLHKITTHVIVGLGETDLDIVKFILGMKEKNIKVSLFAFTPIKGTKLENNKQPSLDRYRKIQYAKEIIDNNKVNIEEFIFDKKGNLIELPSYDVNKEEAIKTSGCSWCTRPYYNDSPNKTFYNIPKVRNFKEG